MNKAQLYKEYLQKEEFERTPYEPELSFYDLVKSGNIRKVKQALRNNFSEKQKGFGKLSKDGLQNIKYHFVITAAMLARYCIEGGLPVSQAYNISDYYISNCDSAKDTAVIDALHKEMSLSFAEEMKALSGKRVRSIHVASVVDYIDDHLHEKITVEELAAKEKVSISHLSRLFVREMEKPLSAYIRDRKLDTARNMLLQGDYLPGELAALFAFADQSYFTEQFREKYGLPPLKYKEKYYRSMHR